MVVELTASRILAPLLGSSVYTWTAVIGTVLLGMSIGNMLGGILIDRRKSKKTLFIFFVAVFLSTALIPLWARYSGWLSSLDINLIVRIILVSFFIFLLPSVFYGTIYPGLLKFYLEDVENTGRRAGSVSAAWSLGSIIGTFLTGFFFIGFMGSTKTVLLMAAVMFFCALVVDFPRKKTGLVSVAILMPLAFSIIGALSIPKNSEKLVYFGESDYYAIKVADVKSVKGNDLRLLILDFDFHSMESEGEIDTYPHVYPIFSILKREFSDIAVIGGGSNLISKNLADFYSDAKVSTVEIDPEVSRISDIYFKKSSNPVETVISDGRMFFEKNEKKFDLVFVDAYNSFISVPWHLTTLESNELIKGSLSEDGIFAINIISAVSGENSLFFQSVLRTIRKTFPNTYVLHYGHSLEEVQNLVIIGTDSERRISEQEIASGLESLPNGNLISAKILHEIPELSEKSLVLTDDFAPVERLMGPAVKNNFKRHLETYASHF